MLYDVVICSSVVLETCVCVCCVDLGCGVLCEVKFLCCETYVMWQCVCTDVDCFLFCHDCVPCCAAMYPLVLCSTVQCGVKWHVFGLTVVCINPSHPPPPFHHEFLNHCPYTHSISTTLTSRPFPQPVPSSPINQSISLDYLHTFIPFSSPRQPHQPAVKLYPSLSNFYIFPSFLSK